MRQTSRMKNGRTNGITSSNHGRGRAEKVNRTFNVLIAYDSRAAAARAMKAFDGLARRLSDEFDLNCDLWRFDMFALPEARQLAVAAGAVADLIIVSARGDNDLPKPVKEWLEAAVAEKLPGTAGLVGLLESHPGSSNASGRSYQFLQSAADRSLMDLFLYEIELPGTGPGLRPGIPRGSPAGVSPGLQTARGCRPRLA